MLRLLGPMRLGSRTAWMETEFTELGGLYTLTVDYLFFMGYRYGIFNYATKALGESVEVISFTSEATR
jgi:hypothetical protein